MSLATTFDTLHVAESLNAAGFEEKQAVGLAKAMKEVQDSHVEDLATKRDLVDLEERLRRDMQALEYRMTIKLGGLMMGCVGVVAAMVKPL